MLETRLSCIHKQNESLRWQIADYSRFFNGKGNAVNDISTARKMLAQQFYEINRLSEENKKLSNEIDDAKPVVMTSNNTGGIRMVGSQYQNSASITQHGIDNFF